MTGLLELEQRISDAVGGEVADGIEGPPTRVRGLIQNPLHEEVLNVVRKALRRCSSVKLGSLSTLRLCDSAVCFIS